MGFLGSFGESIGGVLGLSKGKGENINNPYAADQKDLIEKLKTRAFGIGQPSMAEEQTKQNMANVLQDQVSAVRSSPGLNPALQARLIQNAGQNAQTEVAKQGTIAKLAEQDANVNQLSNAVMGAGNQEIGRQQAEGQAQGSRYDRFGKTLSAVGTAMAASDERSKKNIHDTQGEASDLIDHLKGKLYEYKDNSNGEGVHVGIMAQDLEKSPLGRSMVFEENGMKKVDFGKGFGAVLAAVTEINDRLKDLEKGK
jgi:hypothetical protein